MSAPRAFAAFSATRQQPRFWHKIRVGFRLDRLFQNVARDAKEFRNCFLFESRNLRRRVDPCAEENFVGIDVSDARDQFLVEQNRFHRTAMFPEDLFELLETDVEGVRTPCALFQEFIDILQQSDLAKFALILECEAMGIDENKEHSRMLRCLLRMLEIPERAGHAEMQSQPEVAIGAHKQMFAVAASKFEAASFQSARQLMRRNAFQDVCAPHIDTADPLVQRRTIQVTLECFDIRQLWHRVYISCSTYCFSATALLCSVSFALNRSVTFRLLASRTSVSTCSR